MGNALNSKLIQDSNKKTDEIEYFEFFEKHKCNRNGLNCVQKKINVGILKIIVKEFMDKENNLKHNLV